jgi:hypothetical protein
MLKALTLVLSVRAGYAKQLLDEAADIAHKGDVLNELLARDCSYWRPGVVPKSPTPHVLDVVLLVDAAEHPRLITAPVERLRSMLRAIVARKGLHLVKVAATPQLSGGAKPGPTVRPGGASLADTWALNEASLKRDHWTMNPDARVPLRGWTGRAVPPASASRDS